MDLSQNSSQDVSQDVPRENMPFSPTVAFRPHTVSLPIPSPPPLSPPSLQSSPSLSLTSFTPPQAYIATNFTPNILYYAPGCPTDRFIQPGWSPDFGLPWDLWLKILDILHKSCSAFALLSCALTCRHLREPAQRMIDALNTRRIRSWMHEDIDKLADDVRNTPRDAKRITKVLFDPEIRDDTSRGPAVAISVAPLRLAGQRVLTNMSTLEIGEFVPNNGMIEVYFHSRSCPLYGRAFPHVTQI
ncbi:hypothetical protein NLI96_g11757 [Meripilus lineatus]|uniref:F-box domain-containing protein n=1 Tax=Meripilus lineatus TaxID=2056292 RepID=A0AAD5UTN4_9APHY|nr:hypothetical protein NLI96_g11757 [Physisporinus lineatus]